jgi:hypothetical protein
MGSSFAIGLQSGEQQSAQKQAHKQALSDQELEGKINELVDNRKAIQAKLPTLLDDKGQPTPEYQQAMDALTQNAQALRTIYHPNQNPSAVQKFGHVLTDALHITTPQQRQAQQASKQATAASGDRQVAQGLAAAAPPSPAQTAAQQTQAEIAAQNAKNDALLAWAKNNGAPQEVIDQMVAHAGGAPSSKGTKAVGQPYQDANDQKWYQRYLNADGTDSRAEIPGYTPKASGGGPIRAWTRDKKGKIISVLLDRTTNKPVPGSENYDILPPPYLTQRISTGVFHWTDQDNQVHETPESHTSGPVLPGASAQPASNGAANPYVGTSHPPGPDGQVQGPPEASASPTTSKTTPAASGKNTSPSATGKSGDKILGTKGSAPLNKARSEYSEAQGISTLAHDVLVNNPNSEKDYQFVLTLIRSDAGRVALPEIEKVFGAGGLKEGPERWVANAFRGELGPTLRKQLIEFSDSLVKSTKAKVDALLSNPAAPSGSKAFTAFVDKDGTIYDIPADKVNAFKTKHPDAKEQ